MAENPTISPLLMDRSEPIGNSIDPFGRRALHVLASVETAVVPADYDQGVVTYPNATTEVYQYKKAGVTVRVVTITYTNASKNFISGWTIT